MCGEILIHQLLKHPAAEMLTSITNDCSRGTKKSKDSVLKKLDHNFVVIGLTCNHLHPFGHIVLSNRNVDIAKRVWEGAHEIDAPHIKNLNYQNGVEGHHISTRNTP